MGLPSSGGNTTIPTVVDRFSKTAQFVPLSKLSSAAEMGDLLVQHVFLTVSLGILYLTGAYSSDHGSGKISVWRSGQQRVSPRVITRSLTA